MNSKNELDIEIFINNTWVSAAVLKCNNTNHGYRASSTLFYQEEFANEHLLKKDFVSLSCRFPVSYEFHSLKTWPAFILDILPSGAGRRFWLSKLGLQNEPAADWTLLSYGSGNAPGNIRIANIEASPDAIKKNLGKKHPGFEKKEILERNENFIEYALEAGAPITGSSGAHGDAPKFLLTQDKHGKWHADGALADNETSKHWIVKFPRGKHESDKIILRNEACFMHLALLVGLRVHELPHFVDDALFIPRFDRVIKPKSKTQTVSRLGLESLCSASGISDYGYIFKLESLCETINEYSSNPFEDVMEFIFRDILNFISGNTDNHARNTSLLKKEDGTIELSPLYDFAPMYLDREGIARLNRWKNFEAGGTLDIQGVQVWLHVKFSFGEEKIKNKFIAFGNKLKSIPELLKQTEIDKDIQDRILAGWESIRGKW